MSEKKNGIFRPTIICCPIEVYVNTNLTPTEKALFSWIQGLDNSPRGCYASNRYLAALLLGVTEATISAGIKKLIEEGYIILVGFDGRKRHLKVNPNYIKDKRLLVEKYYAMMRGDEPDDISQDQTSGNPEGRPSNFPDYIKDSSIEKKVDYKKSFSIKEEKGVSNETPLTTNSKESFIREKLKNDLNPLSVYTNTQAMNLLEYWNGLGKPLPSHKLQPTKVVIEGLESATKKLKFKTEKEIKDAIKIYYDLLASPYSKLDPVVPGHRVSFKEFFKFDFTTKERMNKRGVPLNFKSWCDKIMSGSYKEFEMEVENNDPGLSVTLRRLYIDKFRNGREEGINGKMSRQFVMASNKLISFYDKIISDISYPMEKEDLAEEFVNCLKEFSEANPNFNILPGNLCSDYTFENIFRPWMDKNAMIVR